MEDFIETNERYRNGFIVQEYKGVFSLVSARQYEARDGETKTALRFGEIEIGRDKTARLPVAVELGSTKEEAIQNLRIAMMHLDKSAAREELGSGPGESDGVPF